MLIIVDSVALDVGLQRILAGSRAYAYISPLANILVARLMLAKTLIIATLMGADFISSGAYIISIGKVDRLVPIGQV